MVVLAFWNIYQISFYMNILISLTWFLEFKNDTFHVDQKNSESDTIATFQYRNIWKICRVMLKIYSFLLVNIL